MSCHDDQIGDFGEEIHIDFNNADIFAIKFFCETKEQDVLYDIGSYFSEKYQIVVYYKMCLIGCKFGHCYGKALRITEDQYKEFEKNQHLEI